VQAVLLPAEIRRSSQKATVFTPWLLVRLKSGATRAYRHKWKRQNIETIEQNGESVE
jgi:hypothetical protein